MVNALFVSLAVVSASTGVVIAVLLLLTPALRKGTWAKWRCLVWVLLALRLLLPFQLPAIHAPLAVSLPDQVLITQAESTPSPGPVPGEASPAPQQRPVSGPQSLSLLDILSLVWAAGALGFLGFHLVGHLRFRRWLLRCQQRQETPQAEALAQALAKDLGLRRPIPLVVSRAAPSPMTLGFFHPLVVLPPRAYSQEELTFILRHELAHRKGGHLWCKLLLLLAQGVHWFNPLVHWMAHQAEADLELACDDQVVKDAAPAQRQAYAQTILSSLEASVSKAAPLSTQFQGGTHTMKARFQNILAPAPRRWGRGLPALALLAAVLMSGLVACSSGLQLHLPEEGVYTKDALGLTSHKVIPGILLRNAQLTNSFTLYSLADTPPALVGEIPPSLRDARDQLAKFVPSGQTYSLKKNDVVLIVGEVGDFYQVILPPLDSPALEGIVPKSAVSQDPAQFSQANIVFVPVEAACYPNRPGNVEATSSFFYSGFATVLSREDGWVQVEFPGYAPGWVPEKQVSYFDFNHDDIETLDLNQYT